MPPVGAAPAQPRQVTPGEAPAGVPGAYVAGSGYQQQYMYRGAWASTWWGRRGGGPTRCGAGYQSVPSTATTSEQVIIVAGGTCPVCHFGVLTDYYGLAALLCAIVFFPVGVLCCLAMRERRCTNCGAVF